MVPQALGSLPQPLPAAHEPLELFRQTGGGKWFLLNFPMAPFPNYFWFHRVAAPEEQQLMTRVRSGSWQQGSTVT